MMLKMKENFPDITIRPLMEKDLDALLAIECDSFPRPWSKINFLDELNSEHSFPLVAQDPEGVVIGYIFPMMFLDEGHILNVAVCRDHRGRGVARRLVERVIGECRTGGASFVALEVRVSNLAAIALYRKLGFVEKGRRRRYYENREDAILMEYDLTGSGGTMQYRATILSNTEVSPGYFRMRLQIPHEAAVSQPGQFLMVRVRDAIDPLLRRPFGIFDINAAESEYEGAGQQTCLDILYKVVGKGTGHLSTLHHGDRLDVLGPLGRGFVTGDGCGESILVGGGVGLAPLYYLARALIKDTRVRLFAGGRTREDILCITEFERLGVETYVATDDGTLGERGLVTEVLERHIVDNPGASAIFACGPLPMLKAVTHIAEKERIPCQVSLEAYMACGVGACLGCVIKGKDHSEEAPDFRCVCKDGPVFDSRDLLWE